MCFAGAAADSLVAYAPEGNVTSEFLVSPAFFWDTHSNAEELSGISASDVLEDESECSREEITIKGGFMFGLPVVLPGNFRYYYKMQKLLSVYHAGGRNTIISYIHHKDGQKDGNLIAAQWKI